MFINSFFSGLSTTLKSKSSFLALATTVTSATVGSITSYYLFKGDEKNEELDKLNSELKNTKENLRVEMTKFKGQKFEKRFEVIKKQTEFTRKNTCLKDEMRKHNEQLTDLKRGYVPNLENCKKIVVT